MPKALDLVGVRFGRLLVQEKLPIRDKFKKVVWRCLCDCGASVNVNTKSLREKNTRSCGCLHKEAITKHGGSDSKTYALWSAIKSRCYNVNDRSYDRYGGRGITMSQEWKTSYEAFVRDMGTRPFGMTLDRINNESGYCKENCRWATPKEQALNRRSTQWLTYDGTTRSISDWARSTGIAVNTLWRRLDYGWAVDKALTTPTRKYKHD